MKVRTIIFCILLSQVSASFFDEFNGAFSSVENSVGKLFSDVVTDVRTTLGCTILAVKKVLAFGGSFHESSDYDERCGGQSNKKDSSIQESLNSYSPSPPILTTTLRHTDHKEISLSDRISEEVNDSVGKVKKQMLGIIENHDTHRKIEQVKKRLKNSTDRLSQIGVLLHKELDNLTDDVKKVLSRMKIDYIHPTLDNLWKDIEILHDIELKETNPDDAAEIRHIFNDILKVLSPGNEPDDLAATESEKKYSDKAFTLLKDEFEKMKESDESKGIETIMHKLDMANGNSTLQNEINQVKRTNEIPLTFQNVAKQIINETKNEFSVENFDVKDATPADEKSRVVTTVASVSTDKTNYDQEAELPEYAFLIIPKDSRSRQAAVLETQKLIAQSEKSEMIMSSFFQDSDTKGISVFDDPDLFVF